MFKLKQFTKKYRSKHLGLGILAVLLLSITASTHILFTPAHSSAACSTTASAPYGYVSYTVNITQAGTYRVASRIKAPDTTNNAFAIDVGNNCNIKVGDSSAIPANTWTWVDYRDGNNASKIDLTLAAGTYTVNLVGIEPGVKVDRVLLMSNVNCAVTGTGDNCYEPPDTTAPVVAITAPPTSQPLKGTVNVTATADDNQQVSKVDFYYGTNRTLIGTDISEPYSVPWNTSNVADGNYPLTAIAVDSSGISSPASTITVTVKNAAEPVVDKTPPTVPGGMAAALATGTTTPQANLSWNASSDEMGVTGYEVYKNDKLLKTVPSTIANDPGLTIGQSYSYYVIAKDAAGNKSAKSSTVSVTVPDTVIPSVDVTAPVAGTAVSGTLNVTATAADNVAVAKVQFSVDGTTQATTDTAAPYAYSIDTTKLPNGNHTIAAQAVDSAGNKSLPDSVPLTVKNADVTAPGLATNIHAIAAAYNKVVLNWTAPTDPSGIKAYGVYRNGVGLAIIGNVTTYTDSTVFGSTNYKYSLVAMDGANNVGAVSPQVSVTTPAFVDTQAPSTPTNLVALAVSNSQVSMGWNISSDNVGVKSYQVFRNGTRIATIATNSYGDTGLAPGTYSYTVKAVDAANNTSQASAAYSVVVSPPISPNVITGTLTGTITDSKTGAPLGGTFVTSYYNGYFHFVGTSLKGQYILLKIPPGTYQIAYSKVGYVTQRVSSTVAANATTTKSVKLVKQ